jgi:hypothetical protein
MSENHPPAQQPADPADNPAQPLSRSEERAVRRLARRGSSAWLVGGLLVVIGVVFLAQNAGMIALNNWWALFILIPAVAAFGGAWSIYKAADRHLTTGARGSLIVGVILTLVAAAFVFSMNWSVVLPLILILGGGAVLLNGLLPGK